MYDGILPGAGNANPRGKDPTSQGLAPPPKTSRIEKRPSSPRFRSETRLVKKVRSLWLKGMNRCARQGSISSLCVLLKYSRNESQ